LNEGEVVGSEPVVARCHPTTLFDPSRALEAKRLISWSVGSAVVNWLILGRSVPALGCSDATMKGQRSLYRDQYGVVPIAVLWWQFFDPVSPCAAP
jgi:hypothetical protein